MFVRNSQIQENYQQLYFQKQKKAQNKAYQNCVNFNSNYIQNNENGQNDQNKTQNKENNKDQKQNSSDTTNNDISKQNLNNQNSEDNEGNGNNNNHQQNNNLQQIQVETDKEKQIYDIVIIGGGCSALAFILNAYRNNKLDQLIGKNGLCIIEKSDKFGCGTLEDNLIPSNTPSIGQLKYIMRSQEAEMLIGEFLLHIKNEQGVIDMNKVDEAVLPIFKPFLSSKIVEHLKQQGEKTGSLQSFGYFLRCVGFIILRHLKNETNYKIDIKFNHEVFQLNELEENKNDSEIIDLEHQQYDYRFKIQSKTLQKVQQNKYTPQQDSNKSQNDMDNIQKKQQTQNKTQDKHMLQIQKCYASQKLKTTRQLKSQQNKKQQDKNTTSNITVCEIFYAKNIIQCTGGIQKFHPMYSLLDPKKKFTSDQFLKEDSFLKAINLAKQNSVKSISIIGGSHSALSSAYLLLNGPQFYNQDELSFKTEFSDIAFKQCNLCQKIGHQCKCYGNLKPYEKKERTSSYSMDIYNCQIKIFHRHQFRVSPRFNVNAYSGLRGQAKELYEKIIDKSEKRVQLVQFSDFQKVKVQMMQSSFVVECLGYQSNYINLSQQKNEQYQLYHYVNDVDGFSYMDKYHQINSISNMYGSGLGFGLQTDHPLINADRIEKKIRADSLQVYLFQLSQKIIEEIEKQENREQDDEILEKELVENLRQQQLQQERDKAKIQQEKQDMERRNQSILLLQKRLSSNPQIPVSRQPRMSKSQNKTNFRKSNIILNNPNVNLKQNKQKLQKQSLKQAQ